MCNSVKIYCLLFCVFTIQSIVVQPFPNFSFRNIEEKDGLSNNAVGYVNQDAKGLLWIGTSNGFNRYDGTRVKTIYANSSDSTQLQSNSIGQIIKLEKDNVFITTTKGAIVFNTTTNVSKQIINNMTDLLPLKMVTISICVICTKNYE